jgi:hypothetical protein
MNGVTRRHRIYFAAVAILALWVGVWGYFIPAHVDVALPWLVPPLHARFLGAMYLSGTTFMLGCLFARQWAEVRVVLPMIAIWTGMLFIVSLLHLGEFNPAVPPTYVWFAAYFVYPLIAAWLAWRHRRAAPPDPASASRLPSLVRLYLLAQGVVTTLLALALLVAPSLMTTIWPWKITPLLAQLYSAPFLAYGLGSLLLTRRTAWLEVRIAIAAMWVFATGVLLASLIHHALFSAANLSAWLWFGAFTLATLVLFVLTAIGLLSFWLRAPSGSGEAGLSTRDVAHKPASAGNEA